MDITQGLQGLKIALLIDFDNVILGVEEPGFDVELVVNALRSRGIVVMGRAYGDWYRHSRHRRKLMEQGIELVETPVFGPLIKNSADIRIVLDAFEIAMSQAHIDAFCLVSGDSDFLPLIKKLQYLGKTVIVIAGNKFTSDLVRRNCNEFVSYENLLAESVGAHEDVSVIEGAYALLERTINTLHERGMDVRSSTVKQMMLQLNPAFSERTFGCSQFKQFLDRAARARIVQLGERDHTSGEYNVLLPADFEDAADNGAGREVAPPRNSAAAMDDSRAGRTGERRPRRRGGRSTREEVETPPVVELPVVEPSPGDETLGLEGPPIPGVEYPDPFAEDAEDVAVKPSPAPPATPSSSSGGTGLLGRTGLRRGRLRFSARTGGTVTREGQAAPSPAAAASSQLTPSSGAEATPDIPTADAGQVWPGVEAPAAEIPSTLFEVPAATTESAGEAAQLFAIPTAETAAAEESSAEAAPKSTRRRTRTPRTPKKDESAGAPSGGAPAATTGDEKPQDDQPRKRTRRTSASAAAGESTDAAPKKPAPRTRRRKTADAPVENG